MSKTDAFFTVNQKQHILYKDKNNYKQTQEIFHNFLESYGLRVLLQIRLHYQI